MTPQIQVSLNKPDSYSQMKQRLLKKPDSRPRQLSREELEEMKRKLLTQSQFQAQL
jgi:hypothetical protein